MRIMAVVAFVALLAGCSTNANDQAQIVALRKHVATLSQQVQTLTVRAEATTELDLQSKCAVDAKRAWQTNKAFLRSGSPSDSYQSHYSSTLGRCLIYTHTMNEGGAVSIEMLADANEGTEFASMVHPISGSLSLYVCDIGPGPPNSPSDLCNSKADFNPKADFKQFVALMMGTPGAETQRARTPAFEKYIQEIAEPRATP